MGQRKRRIERQAAAKAQAQNREMSLPRVSEDQVMEMDVGTSSAPAASSYAAVASGAAASSASGGSADQRGAGSLCKGSAWTG
eukprot:6227892-Amphidinium_carterae.2